ncbi:MAG: ABC transporter ATP-binding protein [Steroidobacteraceae bacterium]
MTDTAVVTARGLKKLFGRRPVLDLLDLTVERGEAIGLLGANGAGKTTLLKSLLGLLPVDAGRCAVLGEPSSSLSPTTRARIAYVPQAPGQFPWLTGHAMLRYVSAFYPAFDWSYVRDLAVRWKLALRTPIGLLSPGQQQRLSIVRALSTRPEVLVLDEPIASLDPVTRIAVIEEVMSERARRTVTVLFSSHLIGDLERLCSKFAVLARGKIAVMESVAWFRSLARVTLDGDEPTLSQLPVPNAALIRKVADGRRIAVIARAGVASLSSALPSTIRVTTEERDVETLTSEWMQ